MRQSEITKAVELERDVARAMKFAGLFLVAGGGSAILSWNEVRELGLPPWLVASIAAVSALVGVPATVSAGNKAMSSSRAVDNAAGRQRVLTHAAMDIAEKTGIPITRIGVTLWVVYRKRRTPREWIRRQMAEPYLWRQERFRTGSPTPHNGEWSQGRGVVGVCMKTNNATYRDFRPDVRRLNGKERPSREDWKSIERNRTDFGFTRDEYVSMVTRYEQILAQPITDGSKFIGCLSVDVSARHDSEPGGDDASIKRSDVEANLVVVAETLETAVRQLAVRP